MRTFGITGSIAAGKSAVADMLEAYWPVIDADLVSRTVVAPGGEGLRAVVAAFGAEVLTAEGELNRAYVRGLIAQSRDAQEKLNGILHPLIIGTMKQQVQDLASQGHEVVFVSAALMLETGSFKNYDGVILVSAAEDVRFKRLLARDGMGEESARQLMSRQMPDAEKRTFATVIIENNGSLADLTEATWTAMAKLDVFPPA